jgi:hypothetical protein
MFNLTRQQQMVICAVIFLLVLGWTVKAWRARHSAPPADPAPAAAP